MVNNTANLGSPTTIDCNSADTAKSASGKVNCTNLFDNEWFILVLLESGCLLVLSGGFCELSFDLAIVLLMIKPMILFSPLNVKKCKIPITSCESSSWHFQLCLALSNQYVQNPTMFHLK